MGLKNMAVSLIAGLPLPESDKKVEVLDLDKDRITSPVGHRWDDFFLNGLRVSEDFMNDRCSENF
jgi:antitoxin VapB